MVVRVDYKEKGGRARQRARTRRQILDAAVRLMHEGTIPTVEQAAAAADVSPATGYRYFRTQGALLRDAVDAAFPTELVHELEGDALRRLELALAMIMGIESYVALSDIYGVKPREAKEVWRWACKALIRAAVSEARGRSRSGGG